VGRLSGWENVPGGSPTAKASYCYDGEGERVAQQTTVNGVTTIAHYLLGGLEELTGSTLTNYYSVSGVVTAISVGSSLRSLASDGLGGGTDHCCSPIATVDALYSESAWSCTGGRVCRYRQRSSQRLHRPPARCGRCVVPQPMHAVSSHGWWAGILAEDGRARAMEERTSCRGDAAEATVVACSGSSDSPVERCS
jgi:hypothetical protein